MEDNQNILDLITRGMFKALKHRIGIGNPVKGYLLELLPAIRDYKKEGVNYQEILDKKDNKLTREKQGNVRNDFYEQAVVLYHPILDYMVNTRGNITDLYTKFEHEKDSIVSGCANAAEKYRLAGGKNPDTSTICSMLVDVNTRITRFFTEKDIPHSTISRANRVRIAEGLDPSLPPQEEHLGEENLNLGEENLNLGEENPELGHEIPRVPQYYSTFTFKHKKAMHSEWRSLNLWELVRPTLPSYLGSSLPQNTRGSFCKGMSPLLTFRNLEFLNTDTDASRVKVFDVYKEYFQSTKKEIFDENVDSYIAAIEHGIQYTSISKKYIKGDIPEHLAVEINRLGKTVKNAYAPNILKSPQDASEFQDFLDQLKTNSYMKQLLYVLVDPSFIRIVISCIQRQLPSGYKLSASSNVNANTLFLNLKDLNNIGVKMTSNFKIEPMFTTTTYDPTREYPLGIVVSDVRRKKSVVTGNSRSVYYRRISRPNEPGILPQGNPAVWERLSTQPSDKILYKGITLSFSLPIIDTFPPSSDNIISIQLSNKEARITRSNGRRNLNKVAPSATITATPSSASSSASSSFNNKVEFPPMQTRRLQKGPHTGVFPITQPVGMNNKLRRRTRRHRR